jgi:hypothetical protein
MVTTFLVDGFFFTRLRESQQFLWRLVRGNIACVTTVVARWADTSYLVRPLINLCACDSTLLPSNHIPSLAMKILSSL